MFSFLKRKKGNTKNNGQRRGFEAAKQDRMLTDWVTGVENINKVLEQQGVTLRARSREMSKNNAYFKRYIDLCQMFVVGSNGISLENQAMNYPNGEPTPDAMANDMIETAWAEWSQPENCTVHGNLSMTDVEMLGVSTHEIDGAFYVHKVTGSGAGNRFGFALQIFDTDALDADYNVPPKNGGNGISMGIEFDSYSRAVAFYFKTSDYTTTRNRHRIEAKDLYIWSNTWEVGQLHGVPSSASVMKALHMLDGYNEAVVINARTAACRGGWWTATSTDSEDFELDESPEYSDIAPGQTGVGPIGWSYTPVDPKQPTSSHGGFVKTQLREIANGLGVSYNSLANDLEGVNYSSLRVGHKTEQATWKEKQRQIITHLLRPIFADWLKTALYAGAIPLPYEKLAKYNKPAFRGQAFYDVDPLKDMKARQLMLELELISEIEIAAEMGNNYEDVCKSRKKSSQIKEKYRIEETVENAEATTE